MAYEIVLEPDAIEHLRSLPACDRVMILDAIEEQLTHTPTEEICNRKQL